MGYNPHEMPPPPILTPPFLMAALGNFLFFTSLAGFFLLPLHLKELGATETQLGLIMGCYSATAIVTQPVVGAWVDRTGRRPFLVSGALLTAAAALLFAVAPDALALFPVLRLLQGVAYSVYFVANFTLVVDLVPPERRGEALGIFGISGLTSTAVGPALGELVVRGFGFRGFFLGAGVLALAGAIVSARVPEPPTRRPQHPRSAEGLVEVARGIVTAPRLPMTLAFSFGLGLGVVFTFFPTYAATLEVQRVGLFAVAYSLAALMVRAVGGRLVDTMGPRAVIIPALALQVVGAALLAILAVLVGRLHLPPTPFLCLAGVLAGGAHGFLYPALTTLVMDVTPEDRRGRVVGVFSAFMLGGQAAGAMCFGYLAHALGYSIMFGILALVLSGAWLLAFRLDR